jgi:predicted nuclease of predicted toxin-antitoxin system
MRFLADESCDMAVVLALRDAGHDVMRVFDRGRGTKDAQVAQIAQEEQRVLLTEDKDFGQLVHAASRIAVGVVLFRFPHRARSEIGAAAASAVGALGDRLRTAFVVVEPGRFRIAELKP